MKRISNPSSVNPILTQHTDSVISYCDCKQYLITIIRHCCKHIKHFTQLLEQYLQRTKHTGQEYINKPVTTTEDITIIDNYNIFIRDYFVHAPSQWEMWHCNIVSHWLGAYTKWSLLHNYHIHFFIKLWLPSIPCSNPHDCMCCLDELRWIRTPCFCRLKKWLYSSGKHKAYWAAFRSWVSLGKGYCYPSLACSQQEKMWSTGNHWHSNGTRMMFYNLTILRYMPIIPGQLKASFLSILNQGFSHREECYICNISHWLKPCFAMDRKWA